MDDLVRRRAPQSCAGKQLRERFASNVRQLRRAKGLTQEQLARAAAIGRPFLSRIERGHFSVTLETVGALADALEISPATLITANR